jgi:chromosome partitioning protein
MIPRNVKLSEAPSFGAPVYYHDKYSRGSLAYVDVAKELLDRIF